MPSPPVVIIPARNEVRSVAAIVEAVNAAVSPGLVIVVNDQSTDNTACAAREAGATVVSTSPHRPGLGVAMNLGIRTGRNLGFDTFLTIDADGQYDPWDLNRLLALYRSSGHELVVGHRLAAGRPTGMRYNRYCANRLFSKLFSSTIGLDDSTDSQSGLRVFGSKVADHCVVTNAFTYTQEQLLRAALLGFQVVSLPVSFDRRHYGRSRLVTSLGDYAARTVPNLLSVYLRHALDTRSMTGKLSMSCSR